MNHLMGRSQLPLVVRLLISKQGSRQIGGFPENAAHGISVHNVYHLHERA